MDRTPLDTDDLTRRLGDHPGWSGGPHGIEVTYRIGFDAGIAMAADVARAAGELNHHPDIDIRYATVRFAVTTHAAGGRVTDLDLALAERIDAIAADHGATPAPD
jgi:4a-hydroxytetrahydrobiopterin dehydratase